MRFAFVLGGLMRVTLRFLLMGVRGLRISLRLLFVGKCGLFVSACFGLMLLRRLC